MVLFYIHLPPKSVFCNTTWGNTNVNRFSYLLFYKWSWLKSLPTSKEVYILL